MRLIAFLSYSVCTDTNGVQALAARLVDGLVLPVLATEGPVLVSRTAADSHAVEAALRWQLGGSMTAEDALLDCLAFLAGAPHCAASACVRATGARPHLCRQGSPRW